MAVGLLGEVGQLNIELQGGKVAFQLNQQSHLGYRKVNSLRLWLDHTFVLVAKLEVKRKFKKQGVFSAHVIARIWFLGEDPQPKMGKNCWICFPTKRNVCEAAVESDCSGQLYKIINCRYARCNPSRLCVDCRRHFLRGSWDAVTCLHAGGLTVVVGRAIDKGFLSSPVALISSYVSLSWLGLWKPELVCP